MNIAVLTQHFHHGGLETQVAGFVRAVQSAGHRVHLITGRGAHLAPVAEDLGGRVLELPLPESLTAAAALDLTAQVADACAAWGIDLLHLHPFLTLHLGAVAAARLRLPFVVSLHGPLNLESHYGPVDSFLLDHMVLADACRVFCVSRDVADAALTRQPAARCHVLPNAVDLGRFRRAAQDPGGDWALVSRLDDEKIGSVEAFFDVFERAWGSGSRVQVFGDGAHRRRLEAALERRGLRERVWFRGFSDRLDEDLRQGFAGVAGMGRVVLEGGAVGLPVLLLGYDGVKGLVRADALDHLAAVNFSGRGQATLSVEDLAAQLAALDADPAPFDLRPWFERSADETAVWGEYLRKVSGLEAPGYGWLGPLLDFAWGAGEEPVLTPGWSAPSLAGVERPAAASTDPARDLAVERQRSLALAVQLARSAAGVRKLGGRNVELESRLARAKAESATLAGRLGEAAALTAELESRLARTTGERDIALQAAAATATQLEHLRQESRRAAAAAHAELGHIREASRRATAAARTELEQVREESRRAAAVAHSALAAAREETDRTRAELELAREETLRAVDERERLQVELEQWHGSRMWRLGHLYWSLKRRLSKPRATDG